MRGLSHQRDGHDSVFVVSLNSEFGRAVGAQPEVFNFAMRLPLRVSWADPVVSCDFNLK
jgi:hypothetical protein